MHFYFCMQQLQTTYYTYMHVHNVHNSHLCLTVQIGGGGVAYTRWGKGSCPSTEGTELVYAGLMAGSAWQTAGSSEYQCLSKQPQYLHTSPGVNDYGRAYLYGTEFEARDSPPVFGSMLGHNTVCSVCYTSNRSALITIPGQTTCPTSWTEEYDGYLMTERSEHPRSGRAPVCVEQYAEVLPGTGAHETHSQLYFVEARCGGLCPPYTDGLEIACVVCTK